MPEIDLRVRRCTQHPDRMCFVVLQAPELVKMSIELVGRDIPGKDIVEKGGRRYAVFGSSCHGRVVYELRDTVVTGYSVEPTAWVKCVRIA